MSELFTSGRAVDLVLAVLAGELLVLAAWCRAEARGRRIVDLVAAALPGACLLLALRTALTGSGWTWTALWLAAALPAHLADLRRRLT